MVTLKVEIRLWECRWEIIQNRSFSLKNLLEPMAVPNVDACISELRIKHSASKGSLDTDVYRPSLTPTDSAQPIDEDIMVCHMNTAPNMHSVFSSSTYMHLNLFCYQKEKAIQGDEPAKSHGGASYRTHAKLYFRIHPFVQYLQLFPMVASEVSHILRKLCWNPLLQSLISV